MKTKPQNPKTEKAKNPFLQLSFLNHLKRPLRRALIYSGKKRKNPTWLEKNFRWINWIERIIIVCIFLYSIYINSFRLWLWVLGIGAFFFFLKEVHFLYWILKVFLFKRKFFSHRRELFLQGTLPGHFFQQQTGRVVKTPINYKTGHIVWATSEKVAHKIYQEHKTKPPTEIIKL